MDKHKLIKLLESKNDEDRLIGLHLLVNKSKKEIFEIFGIKKDYQTMVRTEVFPSSWYRVSQDCVLYIGFNIFSVDSGGHNTIDLTEEYE